MSACPEYSIASANVADWATVAQPTTRIGCDVKDTLPVDLLAAIRVVADGDALLAPKVTRRLIEQFVASAPAPTTAVHPGIAELTEREREILLAVASGRSNAEIAETMFISHATAKSHVSRLLTKLLARDRAQLVMIAYESGVVMPGAS
jgi:DNA-binding NarL/FixJ family response regulator